MVAIPRFGASPLPVYSRNLPWKLLDARMVGNRTGETEKKERKKKPAPRSRRADGHHVSLQGQAARNLHLPATLLKAVVSTKLFFILLFSILYNGKVAGTVGEMRRCNTIQPEKVLHPHPPLPFLKPASFRPSPSVPPRCNAKMRIMDAGDGNSSIKGPNFASTFPYPTTIALTDSWGIGLPTSHGSLAISQAKLQNCPTLNSVFARRRVLDVDLHMYYIGCRLQQG